MDLKQKIAGNRFNTGLKKFLYYWLIIVCLIVLFAVIIQNNLTTSTRITIIILVIVFAIVAIGIIKFYARFLQKNANANLKRSK